MKINKKINFSFLLSTVICLLPILLALIVYNKLPDQVAVHFDFSGNADNYVPKAFAAFGMPVIFAVINAFVHFRIGTDPKSENMSVSLRQLSKWAVPVITVIMVPVTLFMALGVKINITMLVTAFVGVVIVISGNYLPKCKRNYTIGIKLPWTLNNDENWNKTHRFAGFIWVVGGILFIANAFMKLWFVQAAIFVLLIVVPCVYSYLLYRKQPKTNE